MRGFTQAALLVLAIWGLLAAGGSAAAAPVRALPVRTAKVPVVLDGQQILRPGTPLPSGRLFFVIDRDSLARGTVKIFTTQAKWNDYLRANTRRVGGVTPMATGFGVSLFCKEINLGGQYITVAAGSSLNTLGSMDNQISSINPASLGSWTVISEYTYQQGNQLAIQAGSPAINDLRAYGWNDFASSIAVY